MDFYDKYSMNQNTSIGFANLKNLAILKSILISEGIELNNNVVNTILQGKCVEGLSVRDTILVWNLRETMKYIQGLEVNDESCGVLKKVHQCLCKGVVDYNDLGKLRDANFKNDELKWTLQEALSEEEINKRLNPIRELGCATERALKSLVLIMEYQPFPFGSNMIAQVVANLILIRNGCGVFLIPENKIEEFDKLIESHLQNGGDELYNFIYDNCIQGVK